MSNDRLKSAVIFGSVRSARLGIRVAKFMVRKLESRDHEVTLIDPLEYRLPLLDKMYKEYAAGTAPTAMTQIAEILQRSDGFVIVSAEYNHAEPPALKNLLDHYQSEYHYKPTGIVSYSTGSFGGVRAMIALRSILAELGTPSIPSAFPVSQVGITFDDDGFAIDLAYNKRVIGFLDEYEWYVKALKAARESGGYDDHIPTQQEMCRD